jgi:hypothetical protein
MACTLKEASTPCALWGPLILRFMLFDQADVDFVYDRIKEDELIRLEEHTIRYYCSQRGEFRDVITRYPLNRVLRDHHISVGIHGFTSSVRDAIRTMTKGCSQKVVWVVALLHATVTGERFPKDLTRKVKEICSNTSNNRGFDLDNDDGGDLKSKKATAASKKGQATTTRKGGKAKGVTNKPKAAVKKSDSKGVNNSSSNFAQPRE